MNSSGSHEECYIEETSTEPNKTINLGNADKVNIYVFAVDKVDGIKYLNLYKANQLAEHKEALPPNQNKEVGCEIIALKVIDVQPNNTYTFHAVASSYFGSGYSQSQFIKIVRPLD